MQSHTCGSRHLMRGRAPEGTTRHAVHEALSAKWLLPPLMQEQPVVWLEPPYDPAGTAISSGRASGARELQLFSSAIMSDTSFADLASAAWSESLSLSCTILSTPLPPRMIGTPMNRSFRPYSPLSDTEHGTRRFWSSRIASTISTADMAGA